MESTRARTRWANAFLYAVVTTVMVLSTAILLSFLLGQSDRDLADRVDIGVEKLQLEAANTRELFCVILANAQTPEVRHAVHKYCPTEVVLSPEP